MARRSRRISSSLFPENIGPQITSIQPMLPIANSIGTSMLSSAPLLGARVIRPEKLDDTPPAQARRSLRDLVRINTVFGGHAVLKRTLASVLDRHESFTMLDVGAASGDMGACVRRWYPGAA